MKLLLSDGEIEGAQNAGGVACQKPWKGVGAVAIISKSIAQAQLKHILNLDAKTTTELIVKLQAHLDKLFLKEIAK